MLSRQKKKGTAKITAKVGKKKYVCKVTVKAAATKKSNKNTNRKNNSSKTNGGTQKVAGTPGKNVARKWGYFSDWRTQSDTWYDIGTGAHGIGFTFDGYIAFGKISTGI